jgi:hypothetical protein
VVAQQSVEELFVGQLTLLLGPQRFGVRRRRILAVDAAAPGREAIVL